MGRAELAAGVEDIQQDVVSAAFWSPEGAGEEEKTRGRVGEQEKEKRKKRVRK